MGKDKRTPLQEAVSESANILKDAMKDIRKDKPKGVK